MATLTHNLSIYSDGSMDEQPPVSLPRYIGWRCLHVGEGGYQSDNGMPEIRPAMPNPLPVRMTEDIQKMSYNLMIRNPNITKDRWRKVHGTTVAFNNGNGYPGRRDYINRRDLDKDYPKYMKAIICGGMFIRGTVVGNFLQCVPGVHGIYAFDPMPDTQTIIDRNWYFHAVTEYNGQISNFPQGQGLPVLMPFILREPVTYPLSWMTRWESDQLPDPLRNYL